jgi:hypothetical protein
MKPLPLPVRVAAGLAVTAVDRARHLPEKLAGLPVTMVSQALQLSMRLQQQVTELAIKGDDALATLRPAEESPEWATFDEDAHSGDNGAAAAPRSRFDAVADDEAELDDSAEAADPWDAEERAIVHELDTDKGSAEPAALPNYAELTLPQVRARMRRLTIAQLTELMDFERSHGDRSEFLGMLTRRINTLRDQQ